MLSRVRSHPGINRENVQGKLYSRLSCEIATVDPNIYYH